MSATLSLPGLEPAPGRTRRPAPVTGARPELLSRLLGERRGAVATPERPASPAVPAAVGATLDDLLVGAWEGLMTGVAVICPVCDGDMTPQHAAGAVPAGGRCGSCSATLG